jgi:hypothetical protein
MEGAPDQGGSAAPIEFPAVTKRYPGRAAAAERRLETQPRMREHDEDERA